MMRGAHRDSKHERLTLRHVNSIVFLFRDINLGKAGRADMRITGRRAFLEASTATVITTLGALEGGIKTAGGVPKKPQSGAPSERDIKLPAGGVVPKRPLGRTGVNVSVLGLGGFHIGLPKDEKTAIKLIRFAVDHGCPSDGAADHDSGTWTRWAGLSRGE